MTIKQTLYEQGSALLWAVVTITFINWLGFQLSQVPTGSMIPTVLPGDVLVVSKMHYGARTSQTPLQIPFMQNKIPGTNIPSYLTWLQLPIYRLPGFSKIKRGDCVVFAPPRAAGNSHIPQDMRISYIKRCIGLPGDSIAMVDTKVLINGMPQPVYGDLHHRYRIKIDRRLPDAFFEKYGIKTYNRLAEGGAYVQITEATSQKLKALSTIDDVVPVIMPVGNPDHDPTYPSRVTFAENLGGNEDQLPKITVPKKNMKVVVNKETLTCYGELIRYHEGHKKVEMHEGKLWIDGSLVKEYVFKQNYYFMLGDNRHNSSDSRFWGFVPQKHVIGKAVFILASGKNPDRHLLFNLLTFNVRWNRFFYRI